MPQTEDRCLTCKFFVPDPAPSTVGKCHRNPPATIFVYRSTGTELVRSHPPLVIPTEDWCGEHVKK